MKCSCILAWQQITLYQLPSDMTKRDMRLLVQISNTEGQTEAFVTASKSNVVLKLMLLISLFLYVLQKTAADELAQKESQQNELKGKREDIQPSVRFVEPFIFHCRCHHYSSSGGKSRPVENGGGQSEKAVWGEESSLPLPQTKYSRSKVGMTQYSFWEVYCSALTATATHLCINYILN